MAAATPWPRPERPASSRHFFSRMVMSPSQCSCQWRSPTGVCNIGALGQTSYVGNDVILCMLRHWVFLETNANPAGGGKAGGRCLAVAHATRELPQSGTFDARRPPVASDPRAQPASWRSRAARASVGRRRSSPRARSRRGASALPHLSPGTSTTSPHWGRVGRRTYLQE